ncbi:Ribulose-phosphate binding barrel [Sesbania bispinosa]|nr:Ribulose-phosphate binding barrel [Sesbania bispinosa]
MLLGFVAAFESSYATTGIKLVELHAQELAKAPELPSTTIGIKHAQSKQSVLSSSLQHFHKHLAVAKDGTVTFYNTIVITDPKQNPSFKLGAAQTLSDGAILQVTNPHQAKIAEQARSVMIRIQGDLMGSGNIADIVKNDEDEVFAFAKKIEEPYDLVTQTKQMGRLPVVHFAAGGIVIPANAVLMMQLGCHGVFMGSEMFRCEDSFKHVRGIIQFVTILL